MLLPPESTFIIFEAISCTIFGVSSCSPSSTSPIDVDDGGGDVSSFLFRFVSSSFSSSATSISSIVVAAGQIQNRDFLPSVFFCFLLPRVCFCAEVSPPTTSFLPPLLGLDGGRSLGRLCGSLGEHLRKQSPL